MVELTLPKNSKLTVGKTWPKPERANNLKVFKIYRFDPDKLSDAVWIENDSWLFTNESLNCGESSRQGDASNCKCVGDEVFVVVDGNGPRIRL